MPTDKELVKKAILIAAIPTSYSSVQKAAAKMLKNEAGENWPHNGCAANLSAILQAVGIAVPDIVGAGALANKLGGAINSRGWVHLPVGSQVAGDVGVTFDEGGNAGADHIYFVVARVDSDEMMIADNQASTPHTRFASGKAAPGKKKKTPTEYFLRAPGFVVLGGTQPRGIYSSVGIRALADPGVQLVISTAAQTPQAGLENILELAAGSEIARYDWMQRGKAPMGYIKGMAVLYARMYCKLKAGDPVALEVTKKHDPNANVDALTHYADVFDAAGILGDTPEDRLRQLFVLLMGFGMRESSGRWCEGRDRAANNVTGEKAEAGLFQTSWDARFSSSLMPKLFADYSGLRDFGWVFTEGVTARDRDLENFGSGDGLEFQRLSKVCPAFAVEFAAVGLRNNRKHWGSINSRAAEVKRKADALYRQVAQTIEAQSLCPV
jgi:hypothetical protein